VVGGLWIPVLVLQDIALNKATIITTRIVITHVLFTVFTGVELIVATGFKNRSGINLWCVGPPVGRSSSWGRGHSLWVDLLVQRVSSPGLI
jgi:hypothetical protein